MTTLLTTDLHRGRHRRHQSAGVSWGLAFIVGVAYLGTCLAYGAVQVLLR